MTKKELEEQLMKMPELEQEEEERISKILAEPIKVIQERQDEEEQEEKEITEEEYMRWHIKRGTPHSAMKNMREDFREDFLMKPFYELENPSKEIISLPKEKDELIHKRMNGINAFHVYENDVYLGGTDEHGKDFQICFDAYNFLEWIDTEHLKYIKKQLIKFIKTK